MATETLLRLLSDLAISLDRHDAPGGGAIARAAAEKLKEQESELLRLRPPKPDYYR